MAEEELTWVDISDDLAGTPAHKQGYNDGLEWLLDGLKKRPRICARDREIEGVNG